MKKYILSVLFITIYSLCSASPKPSKETEFNSKKSIDSLSSVYQKLKLRIEALEEIDTLKNKNVIKESQKNEETLFSIFLKLLPIGGLIYYSISYFIFQFEQVHKLLKLWNDLIKTRETIIYEFPSISKFEYKIIPYEEIIDKNNLLKEQGKELLIPQISNLLNVLELMAMCATIGGVRHLYIEKTFKNIIVNYACAFSDYIKKTDELGRKEHHIFEKIGKYPHYPYINKIMKKWGVNMNEIANK
jgi:hypothetical protein